MHHLLPARTFAVRPRNARFSSAKARRRDLWLARLQGLVPGARLLELVERVGLHKCSALQTDAARTMQRDLNCI